MSEARAEDVPAIEAVYARSWRAAYEGSVADALLDELAAERRRRFDWSRGIDDPATTVQVALGARGEVVGVLQADEVLEPGRDLPEITMLYVDPDAWGRGHGTRLHAAGLGWLAERGHSHARLRVVEDHHRARRFYEREGWVLDGDLDPVPTDLATLVHYRRSLA